MTDETGADIGANITREKERSGLSWDRMSKRVYDELGAYAPTSETLRAWGRGEVNPDKVDPIVIAALAGVFKCTVAEISTTAARRLRALEALRNRVEIDLRDPSTKGMRDSPCNPFHSPEDLVLVGG